MHFERKKICEGRALHSLISEDGSHVFKAPGRRSHLYSVVGLASSLTVIIARG